MTDLPLIEERSEGNYFTGDLDAAKKIMLDEYGEHITVTKLSSGLVRVAEHRGGTPDSPNQWGMASSEDEAWRYLIGQDFGPLDAEYEEQALRLLLKKNSNNPA